MSSARAHPRHFRIAVDGRVYNVTVEEVPPDGGRAMGDLIESAPESTEERKNAPKDGAADGAGSAAELAVPAPMSGSVVDVRVAPGDRIRRDDVLLVLSAMKMEHEVLSPMDGVVDHLWAAADDAVQAGDPLVRIRR